MLVIQFGEMKHVFGFFSLRLLPAVRREFLGMNPNCYFAVARSLISCTF